MTPESRYATLVQTLLGQDGIHQSTKKGFGATGLMVNDKLFAMLVKSQLVVKLPRARVDALVESGDGARLDMNGRVMKEWLSLAPGSALDWAAIASEARRFVASQTK